MIKKFRKSCCVLNTTFTVRYGGMPKIKRIFLNSSRFWDFQRSKRCTNRFRTFHSWRRVHFLISISCYRIWLRKLSYLAVYFLIIILFIWIVVIMNIHSYNEHKFAEKLKFQENFFIVIKSGWWEVLFGIYSIF